MIALFSANNKISLRQLQILLLIDIFGSGVTILPRVVSERAGEGGWLSIIAATVFAMAAVFLICSLASRFPDKSFYGYASELISAPLAALACFVFVFKIIASLALELYIFAEIIRRFMLMNTPAWLLIASMILIGSYAASKGFEARARMAEVLVIIIFLPFVLMFILAALDADFSNLVPLMDSAPKPILNGAAFFSFSGIEFLLLSFSYMNRTKSVRRSAVSATLAVGALFVFTTVVTVARFGAADVKRQLWPVIEMMDSVNLPGSFIERQSALILSFWIVSVFAATSAKMFFSSLILRDALNFSTVPKQKYYMLPVAPVVYILSLMPRNISEAYDYMNRLNYTLGIFFMLILPAVLFTAAKLRKRGEGA